MWWQLGLGLGVGNKLVGRLGGRSVDSAGLAVVCGGGDWLGAGAARVVQVGVGGRVLVGLLRVGRGGGRGERGSGGSERREEMFSFVFLYFSHCWIESVIRVVENTYYFSIEYSHKCFI